MKTDGTYSAEQIAHAADMLRTEAGQLEEQFTLEQTISMLSDEVQLLRERGLSDQSIADLFNKAEIRASASDIARFYSADRRPE